jgi:PKD repeat protein
MSEINERSDDKNKCQINILTVMKKSRIIILSIIAIVAVTVASCKKTPAPTVEIFGTTDGYTVTFNPKVTDVNTYAWDFGDGENSTAAKPSHTYAVSGTYTVTLIVKGEGGSATATFQVTIAASFLEMLTGGASAANGKTWVLDPTVSTGVDGGGAITAAMPITLPAYDNILNDFSLGEEYDNEYTFFANGNYTVNPVNGSSLAGAVYGVVTGTIQGEPAYDIGMCQATYSPTPGATWAVHNTDLTVDAITDPNTMDIPPVHANVTFTGKTWISITDGYFGILDFPTTQQFIIKDITADKMHVALFICGYGYGDDINMMMLPTNLIHLTFIPKAAK